MICRRCGNDPTPEAPVEFDKDLGWYHHPWDDDGRGQCPPMPAGLGRCYHCEVALPFARLWLVEMFGEPVEELYEGTNEDASSRFHGRRFRGSRKLFDLEGGDTRPLTHKTTPFWLRITVGEPPDRSRVLDPSIEGVIKDVDDEGQPLALCLDCAPPGWAWEYDKSELRHPGYGPATVGGQSDLTRREGEVLDWLRLHGPAGPAAVADGLGFVKSNAHRLLRDLLDKGVLVASRGVYELPRTTPAATVERTDENERERERTRTDENDGN